MLEANSGRSSRRSFAKTLEMYIGMNGLVVDLQMCKDEVEWDEEVGLWTHSIQKEYLILSTSNCLLIKYKTTGTHWNTISRTFVILFESMKLPKCIKLFRRATLYYFFQSVNFPQTSLCSVENPLIWNIPFFFSWAPVASSLIYLHILQPYLINSC